MKMKIEVYNYIKKIKPDLSEVSIKQYVSNICSTLEALDIPFDLKEICEKDTEILNYLTKKYDYLSRRNKLNSFIIILKHCDNEEVYTRWSHIRDVLNKKYNESNKTHEMSEKEKNQWLTSDEYTKILNKVRKEINPIYKSRNFTETNLNKIADFMIAQFYETVNLRSDLEDIRIVNREEPKDKLHNYLIIRTSAPKYTLVINQYKTSKVNGQIKISLDDKQLMSELNRYIKVVKEVIHVEGKPLFLFYNIGLSDTIVASQLSTRFKNFFLENAGRNFTISTNRKRLISENPVFQKLNKLKEEAEEIAHNDGHSLDVSNTIYFKTDAPKDKVEKAKTEKKEKK